MRKTRTCPRCNGSGGRFRTITKVINGIKQLVEEWMECSFCRGRGRV